MRIPFAFRALFFIAGCLSLPDLAVGSGYDDYPVSWNKDGDPDLDLVEYEEWEFEESWEYAAPAPHTKRAGVRSTSTTPVTSGKEHSCGTCKTPNRRTCRSHDTPPCAKTPAQKRPGCGGCGELRGCCGRSEGKRFFVTATVGPLLREAASRGRDQNGWEAGFLFGVTRKRSWSLGIGLERTLVEDSGKGAYGPAGVMIEETAAKVAVEAFPFKAPWSLELGLAWAMTSSIKGRSPSGSWYDLPAEGAAWRASLDFGYTWFVSRSGRLLLRPSLAAGWGRHGDEVGQGGTLESYDQYSVRLRAGYLLD